MCFQSHACRKISWCPHWYQELLELYSDEYSYVCKLNGSRRSNFGAHDILFVCTSTVPRQQNSPSVVVRLLPEARFCLWLSANHANRKRKRRRAATQWQPLKKRQDRFTVVTEKCRAKTRGNLKQCNFVWWWWTLAFLGTSKQECISTNVKST